jgi:hypothetical protein
VPVVGNRPYRFAPGVAHALYLGFPDDRSDGSFTALLARTLDINASDWFPEDPPDFDPGTGASDSTVQDEPEDVRGG